MDNNYQEVYFDQYCKTCEHEKLDDPESPCNECLEIFVNIGSHKPVKWKEKKKT